MPNHITNTIIVNDMDKFMKLAITVNEEGNEVVDFNKLAPMPKGLELGTQWNETNRFGFDEVQKQVDFQNETFKDYLNKFYNEDITGEEFLEQVTDDLNENDIMRKRVMNVYKLEDISTEMQHSDYMGNHYSPYAQVIMGYFNTRRYGANDWYRWSCDNWGTKWNSYDGYINSNGATFSTAWSCPIAWLEKLAEHIDFKFSFADEDIGANLGIGYAKDGKLTVTFFDDDNSLDGSDREYLALTIRGYDYEDEKDQQTEWYDEEDILPILSEERQKELYNRLVEYI